MAIAKCKDINNEMLFELEIGSEGLNEGETIVINGREYNVVTVIHSSSSENVYADIEVKDGKVRGFEPVKPLEIKKALRYDFKFKVPRRATRFSAGYDMFAPFDFKLKPSESITIPTGFKAYMQGDEFLAAHPRSGFGYKYYVRLANTTGIIDADYYSNEDNDGHIWMKLRNEGEEVMEVEKGEAFVQVIFQKYLLADSDFLGKGDKRAGGIGSTSEKK